MAYDDVQGYDLDATPESKPVLWTDDAARSHVAKVAAATGASAEQQAKMVYDYTNLGRSDTANQLKADMMRRDSEMKAEQAALLAAEGDPALALEIYNNRVSEDETTVLEEQAISGALVDPWTDQERIDKYFSRFEQEDELQVELANEYQEAAKFSGSTVGNVIEFFEMMIPGVEQTAIGRMNSKLKERFGADLDNSLSAVYDAGGLMQGMAEWFAAQPAEDQLEIMDFIVETAPEVSGFFTDNDFIKLDLLDRITSIGRGEYLADDTQVLNVASTVFSLVDLMGVASVAKSFTRGSDSLNGLRKTSNAEKISRIDPEKGAAIRGEALIDPTGNKAKNLGTTQEDLLYNDLMVKHADAAESPHVSRQFVEDQMELSREIGLRQGDLAVDMKAAEKLAETQTIEQTMRSMRGQTLWENASKVTRTDEGVEVTATYAKTDTEWFNATEVEEAVSRLSRQFPEAEVSYHMRRSDGKMMTPTEVEKMKNNPKRNARVQKKMDKKLAEGEYVIESNFKRQHRASDNVGFDLEDIPGRLGRVSKYVQDVSSAMGTNFSDAVLRGHDLMDGMRETFKKMNKPFTSSSDDVKMNVMSALNRGDREGRVLTDGDLIEMLPDNFSDKQIQQSVEAYRAFRRTADEIYLVNNKAIRDQKIAEGYVQIQGIYKHMGRPLRTGETASMAYDPRNGRTLSKKEIDAMVEEGATLYRSEDVIGEGANATRNILVTGDVKVSELPAQVLNYREGYVPRIYNEKFFVEVRNPKAIVDGVEQIHTTKTLVAKSYSEALEVAEKLQARYAAKGYKVVPRNARELSEAQIRELDYAAEKTAGGTFTAGRGRHLKDETGELASIEDPIAAIEQAMNQAAKNATFGKTMQLQKTRWLNTFGDLVESQGDRAFPTKVSQIASENLQDAERVRKARTAWEYINLAEDAGMATQQWKKGIMSLAQYVEGAGFKRTANALRSDAILQRDFSSRMRGLAHTLMIVLNPARQVFLQSQQILFLSGVEGYGSYLKSGGPIKGMMLQWAASDSKKLNKMAKAVSKSLKFDTTEYNDLMQAYRRSGLHDSMESHTVNRDSFHFASHEIERGNALRRGMSKAGRGTDAAVGAISKVGFEAGERFNLSNTYMVAWERLKKQRPGASLKNKQDVADLNAMARQLALGMTSPGAFGYQRGLIGMTTQFLQVQHKAFLAMARGLPGTQFGNKAISKAEARRIAIGQLGLYGATGWGLADIVDGFLADQDLVNISPQAKQLIIGGVYDLMWNAGMDAITGEENNLRVGENVAAGGGFFNSVFDLAKSFLDGKTGVPEIMLGASYTPLSKVSNAMSLTADILNDDFEVTDDVFTKEILPEFGSIFSAYNNYAKGSAMMNSGQWVNKNQERLPIEATDAEAFMKGLLGIDGYKVDDYYQWVKAGQDADKSLDDIANTYVDRITRAFGRAGDYGETDYFAAMKKTIQLERAVIDSMRRADAIEVMKRVRRELSRRMQAGDRTIADGVAAAVMSNKYGSSVESMINQLQQDGMINATEAERLMRLHNEFNGDIND